MVTRNFCTNSPLVGREADLRTGGPCAYDEATSLPDEHCMFYADQETAATASYMALPYLDSVQNFCDLTEDIELSTNFREIYAKILDLTIRRQYYREAFFLRTL